eukprot:scaffold270058_cov31-Prasinocladus_malaysianus.AAC.1
MLEGFSCYEIVVKYNQSKAMYRLLVLALEEPEVAQNTQWSQVNTNSTLIMLRVQCIHECPIKC